MNLFSHMDDVHEDIAPDSKAALPPFKPRTVRIAGKSLETTPVFDAYWYFAAARQALFHKRVSGRNSKVLGEMDPVLRSYRFTNAYRASDRVSQYLIRNVIGDQENLSDEDMFLRILLFKIFNKIETWQALEAEIGVISTASFNVDVFDQILSERQDRNQTNYSAAYIMPSAGRVFGHKRKHSNHLELLAWMLDEKYPKRLSQMSEMSSGYSLLYESPSLGPFLAYQFITDINYSNITSFSESEYVVAGPGALDGISKCFVDTLGVTNEEIIGYMVEAQEEYFDRLDLKFENLWGRNLQLIDCQNIFCEISKYSRAAYPDVKGRSGRTRIKQKYRRNHKPIDAPIYPKKWGLNELIKRDLGMVY